MEIKDKDTDSKTNEKDTQSGSSTDKKPAENQSNEHGTDNSNSQIDQDIAKKKEILDNIKKGIDEGLGELATIRAEKRQLGKASEKAEDDFSSVSDEIEPDMNVKKSALDIFYRYHPEYSPKNDIAGVKFNELNKHFMRLKSGTKVNEVVDTLEYIHENFTKQETKKSQDREDHPGIGNTTGVQEVVDDDEEKLAEKIKVKASEVQKQAASMYGKGEKEYWKMAARLQLERRGQQTSSNRL